MGSMSGTTTTQPTAFSASKLRMTPPSAIFSSFPSMTSTVASTCTPPPSAPKHPVWKSQKLSLKSFPQKLIPQSLYELKKSYFVTYYSLKPVTYDGPNEV